MTRARSRPSSPDVDERCPGERRVASRAHDADDAIEVGVGDRPQQHVVGDAPADAEDLRPASGDRDLHWRDRHLEAASARFVERAARTEPSQQRDQLVDALGRVAAIDPGRAAELGAARREPEEHAVAVSVLHGRDRGRGLEGMAEEWVRHHRTDRDSLGRLERGADEQPGVAPPERIGQPEPVGARGLALARQRRRLVESRIEQMAGDADLPAFAVFTQLPPRSQLRMLPPRRRWHELMSSASRAKPTLSGRIRRAWPGEHTAHRGRCSAHEDVVEPLVGHQRASEGCRRPQRGRPRLRSALRTRARPALAAPRGR